MRKVLNFVKGKKDEKKDANLSLNVASVSVEITDPSGVTTPSDDYDFIGTTQQCSDYEVDLTGKDKSITKLHKAAWVGNLDKVKSHLKKMDVNSVDASNRTPLHLAAAQGHISVVWFLLSNKAAMDVYDSGGKTSFLKAVEGGYKEIVNNMLEKGAELNSKDSEGNTALHIATKLGYYDIATVLLKKGANFEGANKKGEFPLHIATTAEHMDLVELLLRYGAEVNVTDNDARTPLMLSARCGNAPLVELFLEYGAKRDLVDNSSFTAQDYAINKGYGDLAALLVTAAADKQDSEIKSDKVPDTDTTSSPVLSGKQHSVSSGSLVPANGSHQDVSDVLDDEDSWNDSQASESKDKTMIPASKLKKFLSPSSDDEIDEELSPTKKEKNVLDSPHSCVIPPRLKPPRSWDLIQAGMIDDNTGSEVKRCSLTTLGTLRLHRESFNDSNKSDIESPNTNQSLKDVTNICDPGKTDSAAPKHIETSQSIEPAVEIAPAKQDKSDLSAVESDWDSDESLPPDKSACRGPPSKMSPMQNQCVSVDVHYAPAEDDDLPAPPSPSQLIVPEDTGLLQVSGLSAPGSGAVSPEPVSEKRLRMLLMQNQQSVELTLTDDRSEDKSDHSGDSPTALPRDLDVEENGRELPSVVGTLGREGTMLGYEEIWELNAAFAPTSPTNQDLALTNSHSLPRIDEKREPSEGEPSPSSQIIIDLNLSTVTEIPDSIALLHSPIDHAVANIPPPSPLACVGESEEVEDHTKKLDETTKTPGMKRHVRNKSVFVPPVPSVPSQPQVEVVTVPAAELPIPVPQPYIHQNECSVDQCIGKQLECYDEAIRDLALATSSKEDLQDINPVTNKVLKSDRIVNLPTVAKMPDLLSDTSSMDLTNIISSSNSSNPNINEEIGEEEEDGDEIDGDEDQTGQEEGGGGLNRPIRKKRKILLAMQKFEPSITQTVSTVNMDLNSSDSDEEPAYWGSAGISKVARQSTVIRKGDASDDEGHVIEPPSWLSPGSISLSEDVQHIGQLSSGSSNEDVTAAMEDVAGVSALATGIAVGLAGDFVKGSDTLIAESNVDSGASQIDSTSTHSFSKSHDSLLKHHLQAVTEERGRLAETTVELGERTEQLLYELADAREAARARDEVISLLQIQLQRLEESHCRGLEEVQTHRFHLDSRDQELRHLEEVCRKAEEEKIHLKEIIRLKDKEIASLAKARASKEEEIRLQLMAREREKDVTISELKIHLKYIEQERDKLQASVERLEQHLATLQAKSETLLEEKAQVTAQNASELHIAQEEANKWRNLYESSLVKLEAVDSTQVKVLLDAVNDEGEAVQSYREEIRNAVERLERDKDADRRIWQARIRDEVASAVQVLKSEYEKVEETLRKHNKMLEEMVEKLQNDLDTTTKRQESLESQLSATQEELNLKRKEAAEAHQLQLNLSEMKHQALTGFHKLKTLSAELETKEVTINNLQSTIEVLRRENTELCTLLSQVQQQQEAQVASEWTKLSEAVKEAHQTDAVLKETRSSLEFLRGENANLKEMMALLKSQEKQQTEESKHDPRVAQLLEENEKLNQNICQITQQLEQLKQEQKLSDASSGMVSKAVSETENILRQEKEDLERQVRDLKSRLQKRDGSPGPTNLSNASAMTDQVRWNQSGLMGVVQKQKEEIEHLKSECTKLRNAAYIGQHVGKQHPSGKSCLENSVNRKQSSTNTPKLSQDSLDLINTTRKLLEDNCADNNVHNIKVSVERQNQLSYICENCGVGSSPKNSSHLKKENTETQTIEGCDSPAHSSKCSSPRHNWNKKASSNVEQELQAQAERCLKHQQMIAGLKSELQLLRSGDGGGDQQANLQKQISELQQKIKEEFTLRCSLEMQMNKMKYEVQEKGQLERELEKLKGRLDKDFVSRRELDHMKMRVRQETESTLHSELSTRLAQVNKLLLQQAHDRSTGQAKESAEAQIRKEYEETRQYLISELTKVQASLQAKEDEEKELKLKCEKLSRECDKKNEERRKKLIEKSYNLFGKPSVREREVVQSEYKSPLREPQVLDVPSTTKLKIEETGMSLDSENPYSQLLHKEVKRSVEKYKTRESVGDLSTMNNPEEHMEYLKKKYCLP